MKKQNGFTLVELAIALMVIGLLIGGVLKGQELIENARITSTIRQLKAYDTAAIIFRNTYGALPGDIQRPTRIPNCAEDICNMGGSGNGRIIDSDTSPVRTEMLNFFPHMTKAGMIQGPEGGRTADRNVYANRFIFYPTTALNDAGEIELQWFSRSQLDLQTTNGKEGHYYTLYGITCIRSQTLDNKIDDSTPNSGAVFSSAFCQEDDDDGNKIYKQTIDEDQGLRIIAEI